MSSPQLIQTADGVKDLSKIPSKKAVARVRFPDKDGNPLQAVEEEEVVRRSPRKKEDAPKETPKPKEKPSGSTQPLPTPSPRPPPPHSSPSPPRAAPPPPPPPPRSAPPVAASSASPQPTRPDPEPPAHPNSLGPSPPPAPIPAPAPAPAPDGNPKLAKPSKDLESEPPHPRTAALADKRADGWSAPAVVSPPPSPIPGMKTERRSGSVLSGSSESSIHWDIAQLSVSNLNPGTGSGGMIVGARSGGKKNESQISAINEKRLQADAERRQRTLERMGKEMNKAQKRFGKYQQKLYESQERANTAEGALGDSLVAAEDAKREAARDREKAGRAALEAAGARQAVGQLESKLELSEKEHSEALKKHEVVVSGLRSEIEKLSGGFSQTASIKDEEIKLLKDKMQEQTTEIERLKSENDKHVSTIKELETESAVMTARLLEMHKLVKSMKQTGEGATEIQNDHLELIEDLTRTKEEVARLKEENIRLRTKKVQLREAQPNESIIVYQERIKLLEGHLSEVETEGEALRELVSQWADDAPGIEVLPRNSFHPTGYSTPHLHPISGRQEGGLPDCPCSTHSECIAALSAITPSPLADPKIEGRRGIWVKEGVRAINIVKQSAARTEPIGNEVSQCILRLVQLGLQAEGRCEKLVKYATSHSNANLQSSANVRRAESEVKGLRAALANEEINSRRAAASRFPFGNDASPRPFLS